MKEKIYYENMWKNVSMDNAGCRSYNASDSVKFLLDSIPKNDSSPQIALDLGSGIGRHIPLLLEKGYLPVAADFSQSALDSLKEKFPSVKTINADITNKLPLDSGSLDLILDSGCLHHLHVEDYASYVNEVNRVIKSGKYMILFQFKNRGDKTSNWEGDHFTRYFPREELQNLFVANWDFLHFEPVKGKTGKDYWAVLLKKK